MRHHQLAANTAACRQQRQQMCAKIGSSKTGTASVATDLHCAAKGTLLMNLLEFLSPRLFLLT